MHIGKLLKEAIEKSPYTKLKVIELVGCSSSTLYRWFKIPNLQLKEVMQVFENCPRLNLRRVFEALEEQMGEEIADNPYRKLKEQGLAVDNYGVTVTLDSKRYAGRVIPPDLEKYVSDYIERYQQKAKEEE